MGDIGVDNFSIGQAIQAGYINSSDGRIGLNLMDAGDNVVLHFNPRFDQKVLVLNSKINGSWGPEEKPKGYDFDPQKSYTVDFLATEAFISISLDGKHFYDYKNRLPITSVVKVSYWSSGSNPAKLHYLGVKF